MPVLRTGSLLTSGVLASSLVGVLAPPAAAEPDLSHDHWALEAIAAQEAWQHGRGAGVSVAVLGSGVDATHPDLGYAGGGEDPDASAVTIGEDFTGEGSEAGAEGEGTALAGIIAARGHGEEFSGGVLGVAPEAEILALRVMEEGQTPEGEPLASAVRQAALDGAQVALLPSAPDTVPAEVEHAIDYAQSNGVVVVAPAAESGYEGLLSVAAVGADNFLLTPPSEAATLAAPGQDVPTIDVDGGYSEVSGPQAAAALVAGTAALVRSAYPRLHPEQVAEAVQAGARLPEVAEGGEGYGAGVLNAEQALAEAKESAQEVPPIEGGQETAQQDEGIPWWGPVSAATAVVLLVVLVVLLRRRWSDPYQLAGPKVTRAPRSGRRSSGRRGRRARGHGARRS